MVERLVDEIEKREEEAEKVGKFVEQFTPRDVSSLSSSDY